MTISFIWSDDEACDHSSVKHNKRFPLKFEGYIDFRSNKMIEEPTNTCFAIPGEKRKKHVTFSQQSIIYTTIPWKNEEEFLYEEEETGSEELGSDLLDSDDGECTDESETASWWLFSVLSIVVLFLSILLEYWPNYKSNVFQDMMFVKLLPFFLRIPKTIFLR